MILRIDHVSIAVKDFEKADQFFRTLLGGIPVRQGKTRRPSTSGRSIP
jgi:catechol 2,3-dioxygenase-like lactoylglutathione lyase family enzyme